MIEVINGKDWSSSENRICHMIDFSVSSAKEEIEEMNNDSCGDNAKSPKDLIQLNPYEFFEIYSSLAGNSDKISPINLGIYLDKDYKIHSTQFVGIVPLIDKELKPYKINNDDCVIKINSRFHISPSMMLKEILEGDDYYENPSMLQCNAYKISEIKDLFGKGKKNKVLCGTIKDIGKIILQQGGDTTNSNTSIDSFLSGVYPIFEVIRFVNLAKEVCKKNLKQQSVYKEDNLVGKVKGRILLNKQLKQNLSRGQYQKTYCAYNALSDDIKENVILKYTLHLCSRLDIADSLREEIMFCNNVLANVPLKKCNINDFVGLKSNGAFRQYKQAMDAAKIILRKYYISYDNSEDNKNGKDGTVKVADYSVEPYFVDMNLLFEYYCRALFRKAINRYNQGNHNYVLELEPVKAENKKMFKENSYGNNFYIQTYIPDILVKYRKKEDTDEKVLTVIDAKYSDVEHSGEKRARTHQVLFYMNVLDCNYGGLISPSSAKADESSMKRNSKDLVFNYLYDGKQDSRQKLCYLPLFENEPSKDFADRVYDYLVTIIEEKADVDLKEHIQLELSELTRNLVGTISQDTNGQKIRVNNEMKEQLMDLANKYSHLCSKRRANEKGE